MFQQASQLVYDYYVIDNDTELLEFDQHCHCHADDEDEDDVEEEQVEEYNEQTEYDDTVTLLKQPHDDNSTNKRFILIDPLSEERNHIMNNKNDESNGPFHSFFSNLFCNCV